MLALPTLRAAILSSSFDPNLAVWYDASRIVAADGDPIGTWADLSGNGRDATQATTSKKPTYRTGVQNGLSVVRFDGTDDNMLVTVPVALAQPTTIIVCGRRTSTGLQQNLVDGSPVRNVIYVTTGGSATIYATTASPNVAVGTTAVVLTGVFNTTNSYIRVNGVSGATGNIGTTALGTTIYLGSSNGNNNFLNGDTYEVLIYNVLLTLLQIQSVEAYLKTKWGTL